MPALNDVLVQLAWPDEFSAALERLADPLEKATDPVVTGLPAEVTDAVSVNELPAVMVELESESEVDVAACIGGGIEEDPLPQEVNAAGKMSNSAKEELENRFDVFMPMCIQPACALPGLPIASSPFSGSFAVLCRVPDRRNTR